MMADTSASVARIPPTESPIVAFSRMEKEKMFFTNLWMDGWMDGKINKFNLFFQEKVFLAKVRGFSNWSRVQMLILL